MPRLAVFLDDGGVMNDNETRSLQWQHLVAEYLAPKLGGNPDDWGEANRIVAELEFKIYKEHPWQRPDADHLKFRERGYEDWLSRMCEQVGVDAPAGEECVKMARETNEFVTRRADPPAQARWRLFALSTPRVTNCTPLRGRIQRT